MKGKAQGEGLTPPKEEKQVGTTTKYLLLEFSLLRCVSRSLLETATRADLQWWIRVDQLQAVGHRGHGRKIAQTKHPLSLFLFSPKGCFLLIVPWSVKSLSEWLWLEDGRPFASSGNEVGLGIQEGCQSGGGIQRK